MCIWMRKKIHSVKLEDFCWHFFDENLFGRDLYNSDGLDRESVSPKEEDRSHVVF